MLSFLKLWGVEITVISNLHIPVKTASKQPSIPNLGFKNKRLVNKTLWRSEYTKYCALIGWELWKQPPKKVNIDSRTWRDVFIFSI